MRCSIGVVGILLWLSCIIPAQGQPRDEIGHTRAIKLTESAGVERRQTPVEVTVRFEQNAVTDPAAIRLERVEGEARMPVACQVLEVARPAAVDDFAPVPQAFVRLAFLADVPASATVNYEV